MGPVSKSRLVFNVDNSFLEFSNNISYSLIKKGSATKGYSEANTNFCPSGFPNKYDFSFKSKFKISSKLYCF